MKKRFNIKSYDINLKKNEIKFAIDCLKKNEIANGSYKKKFENSIKKITKSKYAVACANGTAALFLSLKLIGVKENDEVIVPAFSFIASINAIKYNQETLAKNKGSILLYSTIAVKQGFTNHTIVSSAKGALEALTLSLAAEFAPKIRVNCIAPSLTDAKMTQKLLSNETIKKAIENMHPLPKIGSGDDFSDIGSYLLSDKNSWITGQIFHIDGGRSSLRIKS